MAQVSVKTLDRKHPDYDQYSIPWENIDLLIECGSRLQQHAERFLFKRPRELFDVYQERLKRISHTPLLGTAMGWYGAALFRRQPEVDTPEDNFYADFLENCDRQGTKFIDQWRTVFDNLMAFGRAWVMVDSPSSQRIPANQLEESMLGLDQPYTLVFDPRAVINWAVDAFGNLDWVVTKTMQQDNTFLGTSKPKFVWTYYDRQGYKRYESEIDENRGVQTGVDRLMLQQETMATLVDEGTHALSAYNICPFKQIVVRRPLWLANRAYLQVVEYLNMENTYGFALFQANLAMPVVFTDNEPNFVLSETSLIKLGKDDRFGWTEPEGRSFKASEDRLSGLREEIFRAMYLQSQGRSSNATAAMQSGFSKLQDMMPANDVLNAFGDLIRVGMEHVLKMVALARRDEKATFYCRGFRFETKPAVETVALADEVSALNIPSDTLRREMQKRVARDVLEDSGQDVLNAACKEIDEAPEPEQVQLDKATQAFQDSLTKTIDRNQAKSEVSSTND